MAESSRKEVVQNTIYNVRLYSEEHKKHYRSLSEQIHYVVQKCLHFSTWRISKRSNARRKLCFICYNTNTVQVLTTLIWWFGGSWKCGLLSYGNYGDAYAIYFFLRPCFLMSCCRRLIDILDLMGRVRARSRIEDMRSKLPKPATSAKHKTNT